MTKTETKKLPSRPTQLYAEPVKEYRMRCLLAVMQDFGPARIDDLLIAYRENFPDDPCVKETISRSLHVMEKRGVCARWIDQDDGRAILWMDCGEVQS